MKAKRDSKKFLRVSLFFVCLSLLAVLPAILSADNPPRGWLTKNLTLMTWNVQDPPISIPPSPGNPNDKRNYIKYVKEELNNNEYPLSVVGIQEDFNSHIFDIVYDNHDFMYFIHPTLPVNLPEPPKTGDGLAVFSDFVISNYTQISWEVVFNLAEEFAQKGFVWSIIRIPVAESNDFVIHFYNLHANSDDCGSCKDARANQLEQLSNFMNLHSSGMPVIVSGDFNIDGISFEGGAEYSSLMIWAGGQNLQMANERTVVTHPGDGATYDYIFYRSGYDNRIKLTSDGYSIGYVTISDHNSVKAKLSYSVNYDAFPDLTITDIQYQMNSEGILNAYVTVKNLGPNAIPDGTIRVDLKITGEKNVNRFNFIQALACGESTTVGFELEDLPSGSFTGIATVDKLGEIKENNEFNNELRKTFGTGLPDVVIDRVWLEPADPLPGQQVNIYATIRNQGDGATPSGTVVAAAFKVDGGALGAFFVRTNGVDRPLAAGESFSAACETQWTATDGEHTCWVMADDVNRFPESDENNNIREIIFGNPIPDGITVTSPNGGENLTAGSSHNIAWTSTGSILSVNIDYSTNNGSSWINIASETPNDGSYSLTIPSTPSTTCLIRVSSSSNTAINDVSNAAFTISADVTPTVTVTSPNGGDNWLVGSGHSITWNSTGVITNVKLEYSTNNGSSWSNIIASTANDGSYLWTIPNTPSTSCLVKISNADYPSMQDLSNQNFTITSSQTYTVTVDIQTGHGWILPDWVCCYRVYTKNPGSSFSVTLVPEDGYYGWYYTLSGPGGGTFNFPANGIITIPAVNENRNIMVYFTN